MGITEALEFVGQYNTNWGLSGPAFDESEGDDLRVATMFAFQKMLAEGDVQYVDIGLLPVQLALDELIESAGDYSETSEDLKIGTKLVEDWFAREVESTTVDLVQGTVEWTEVAALGGTKGLALLIEVAELSASRYSSQVTDKYPQLTNLIKESIKWLLVAAGAAAAAGREDKAKEMDRILSSFWLGNPVIGLTKNPKVLVLIA